MAVDGYLNFDTKLDVTGINNGFTKVNSTIAKGVDKAKNMFSDLAKAAAAALSLAALVNFGKECIELGSDLEEVQNVVDVTFPAMTKQVDKWAKSAASSFGLSETMAKKYVGTFGSMAEAFGFTEEQAYEMSTALTGLAGDVASFYNIRQDEAYTKLKSVFSGETETLKDLGIVMTQTALDSYALAKGYSKTTAKMTEAEKVSLRFAFVQDQLANATGDFARTQDSWANQTRVLQLRFDSLKATLGQGLINVFTPIIKSLNTIISKLTTASEKFKSFTEQVFGYSSSANSSSADMSSEMSALTDEAKSTTKQLGNVADKTEDIKSNLAGFDKLNVLSSNSNAATTTADDTVPAQKAANAAANAIDDTTGKLEKRTSKLLNSISRALDKVKTALTAVADSWKRVWNNGTGEKVINNIKKLLGNVFDIVSDIAGAFTKAWNKAGLGDKVVQSIIDKWNSLIELINVVARDFRRVWNNGTGERIWTNILNIITNCNNATKTLREKIKKAWDKNKNGERIWGAILGIVEDITDFLKDMSKIQLGWLEKLDLTPLVTAVADLGEAFRKLLKACGDKLKQAYKDVLLPLAKWTIEKAVPALVEALAGALNLLGNIIESISPAVINALAAAIIGLGTAVAVFKAGQAIASGIDKVRGALSTFLNVLKAHPAIAVVGILAGAITALVSAMEAAKAKRFEILGFDEATEKMQGYVDIITSCKDEVNELCDGIQTSLENTSADMRVIDNYKKRLDELLQKANLTPEEQAELKTIGDYFSEKYPEFEEAWNNYIKKDENGKLTINGNIDEIVGKLDGLINKYKQLAGSQALSELAQENTQALVKSQQTVSKAAAAYRQAQKDFDNWKKEWNFGEDDLNLPGFYTWQSKGIKEPRRNSTVGDLKEEYNKLKSTLEDAEREYNDVCSSTAQLELNSDDLAKMQAVVNGNYADAATVLMAYNAGLISAEDVQNSQWKSLQSLEMYAKDSGKNIVFGMSNGIEAYKDEVKKKGLETASYYLNSLNGKEGLDEHSPSKKTYQSGVFAVQGLINGINESSGKLSRCIVQMLDIIRSQLRSISKIFSDAFMRIAEDTKTPMNIFLANTETFVNNFLTAISNIQNSIPDTLGLGFKISKMPQRITIPKLATGTVVPASYGEFLAVLGDNKREAEVISPLSTMKQAVKEALQEVNVNANGGGDIHISLEVDGEVLHKTVVRRDRIYQNRHGGKSAFATQ